MGNINFLAVHQKTDRSVLPSLKDAGEHLLPVQRFPGINFDLFTAKAAEVGRFAQGAFRSGGGNLQIILRLDVLRPA